MRARWPRSALGGLPRGDGGVRAGRVRVADQPGAGTLSLGVVGFLVSDFMYGFTLVNGTGTGPGRSMWVFLAFFALAGFAALTTSMTKVASTAYARHLLGPWQLGMLAVALLVAPSALLIEATAGPITTAVAVPRSPRRWAC